MVPRRAKSTVCIVATTALVVLLGCAAVPPARSEDPVEQLPGVERLTRRGGGLFTPDWSPDGSLVVGEGGGHVPPGPGIWVLDIRDMTYAPLSQSDPSAFRPVWAPSGRRLAFYKSGGIWETYFPHGRPRFIADGSYAAWSPDGGQLAVAGRDTVDKGKWTIKLIAAESGKELVQLAEMRAGSGGGVRSLDWTPDGKRILYAFGATSSAGEIYSFDLAHNTATQLTDTVENETDIDISPDGARVAFVAGTTLSNQRLFAMNADGSDLSLLLDVEGLSSPQWSPDSSQILFAILGNLFLLDLDPQVDAGQD